MIQLFTPLIYNLMILTCIARSDIMLKVKFLPKFLCILFLKDNDYKKIYIVSLH